jgi:serine/threonine-protein kinase RsbW
MSDRPDLCLELVSNPVYLCGVREMVAVVARRLGFTDAQAAQVALAVDEALANVMKHGYQKRLDGRIWLRLTPEQDCAGCAAMRIVIEDEAPQVDPDQIKGRDLEDIRPGGLGVHIIKEVMDQVTYEKRDGRGMRLTMVKRQAPGQAKGG